MTTPLLTSAPRFPSTGTRRASCLSTGSWLRYLIGRSSPLSGPTGSHPGPVELHGLVEHEPPAGSLPHRGSVKHPNPDFWHSHDGGIDILPAPFLIVREWTRALSSFLNDGDTRPLARLARNPIVTLGKRLQRDMPKALRNLPRAFEQFGDALVKCHSPGIGARAAHLRGTASEARDEVGHDPQLRPLGLVLDRVVCALSEFPEEHTSKKGNLKAQRAAASWCLRYGLAMQALTFLREAFVTALAELSEHGRNQSRTDQDLLLGALERAFSNQSSGERWQAEQVEAWRQSPPVDESLWARLKPALSKLKNMRNELNHAYTNPNAPRDLPISDKDWTAAGKELTEILEGLIDCIERS